jgi:hypothetical protein
MVSCSDDCHNGPSPHAYELSQIYLEMSERPLIILYGTLLGGLGKSDRIGKTAPLFMHQIVYLYKLVHT